MKVLVSVGLTGIIVLDLGVSAAICQTSACPRPRMVEFLGLRKDEEPLLSSYYYCTMKRGAQIGAQSELLQLGLPPLWINVICWVEETHRESKLNTYAMGNRTDGLLLEPTVLQCLSARL